MKPRFTDNQTAALIGRVSILEELVESLMNDRRTAWESDERQESRISFLEERLASLTRPRALLTEKEAAGLLHVSLRSMRAWRTEKPARIPFILLEGGDVRYRAEEIESYLKSRERGNPAARKGAAQ